MGVPYRLAGSGLFLLVAMSLVQGPHLARAAGEWHTAPLPPGAVAPFGQGAPSAVAFFTPVAGQPLDGFIAMHTTGTGGSLIPFVLPADAPPSWDPASVRALGKIVVSGAWRVATSGRKAVATNGASEIYVYDDPNGTWLPLQRRLGSIIGFLAYDAQGADLALAAASNGSLQGVWQISGGVLATTRSATMPAVSVALSGNRALFMGTNGVFASADGGATFAPTGLFGYLPALVAPPGSGAFWGVGPLGFYVTFDDVVTGSWTAVIHRTLAGSENFVALARLGGEAWVLQDKGTVYLQANGDLPSWLPGGFQQQTTGLASARDLAVFAPRQAVAVGTDAPSGAGNAMIAWRNRAPLDPLLQGSGAGEEGTPFTVQVSAIDPDRDPIITTWSACNHDPLRITLTPNGASLVVDAADVACPGDVLAFQCDVQHLEVGGELLASGVAQVNLSVNGVDLDPPLAGPILLQEGASVLTQPVTVLPGALLTATLTASDDCALAPAATAWRLLDASGQPLSGLPASVDLAWTFPAPDPGGASATYQIEATALDASGNSSSVSVPLTVAAEPVIVDLVCPSSVVAGESALATATVLSGIPTGLGWTLQDPSAAPAKLVVQGPDGMQAQISTEGCGVLPPGEAITLRVTPEGPSGGDPTSCTIEVLPGAERPALGLDPAGEPIVWQLPATGGALSLEPAVTFACATPTPLRFDLGALPAELIPPEAVSGWIDQASPAPLLLSATEAQVAALLGVDGVFEGPVTLELSYLPGGWHNDPAHPPLRLTRTLRIVPRPQLSTRISLPGLRQVQAGAITTLRVIVASDVPVSNLELDLDTPGLVLVPGSTLQLRSACASPRLQAVSLPAGLRLSIDALPAACEVEVSLLMRVGFGAVSAGLQACAWREGPLPCAAQARIRREKMFGCLAGADAGGVSPGFILLFLFGTPLVWRRRR